MRYTVFPFYVDEDGQECPWTEPFRISAEEFGRYKDDVEAMIAGLRRPSAAPNGPPPDGIRIEDEEGVVVLRYPPQGPGGA